MPLTQSDIKHLCDHAGVKVTPVRMLILRVLSEAMSPMSVLEIEQCLQTVDRSSISRAMVLFSDNHVVHTIDDGSGSVKYELCRSCCHEGEHDDLHPHFYCTECDTTVCFSDIPFPRISLPPGYLPVEANYVIKGLCPRCAARHKE